MIHTFYFIKTAPSSQAARITASYFKFAPLIIITAVTIPIVRLYVSRNDYGYLYHRLPDPVEG